MVGSARRLREWLGQLRNDNAQGEYYLTDVVVMAARAGLKVDAILAEREDEVLGVNDKVQLAEVEAVYRRRRAQELMLQGVTLVDPLRFDARGTVTVGRDVQIDVNVVFEGDVRLGDRVRIGPNVYMRDCEVGDDVEIQANCVCDHAKIGARAIVGPFARLRPDAVLREEVHVGNFVEVKKAELRRGAKANHLTYIGDARIGAGSNIGAGTITCNYDGVLKHRTEIGARVFVGSNTALVAPLAIGDGAVIGAGSVITADVPAGALALGRGRQTVKPGLGIRLMDRLRALKAARARH
jgi:bifunctional UDP-N-acetylglucosamine pyrophosphorylase/glucosamine-1-phosphate N-acetyltransferase